MKWMLYVKFNMKIKIGERNIVQKIKWLIILPK